MKTVSCILLLALYRADFPVDVNVGRIMARLGWVPLETEEALEELSQYAPEPAVYTFLRERLNSFGLQTLFELHYHMITLGKVFCEKRTPNCAACPLRDMCEYASSGGKRQQKESDHPGEPEPAPARAAAVPVETAEREPEPARADAATPETPAPETPRNANELESVLAAGAVWESGGRPPVGAPAVLLLDPGAGWAEARLAHARLSRAVHPDKCADARARAPSSSSRRRAARWLRPFPRTTRTETRGVSCATMSCASTRTARWSSVPAAMSVPFRRRRRAASRRRAPRRDATRAERTSRISRTFFGTRRNQLLRVPTRVSRAPPRKPRRRTRHRPCNCARAPRRCPRRACATSSSRGASPRK